MAPSLAGSFMDMVEAAIREKQVRRYPAFSAWAKRVSKAPRPADPLAPPKRSKKQKENDQARGMKMEWRTALPAMGAFSCEFSCAF